MNIFILDGDTTKAAQAHCDRHCSKMILETAQLICSALRVKGVDYGYKLAYHNHPCCKWSYASAANFEWLRSLGIALGAEFTHRYGTVHKSTQVIANAPKIPIEDLGLTPFYQAVTDECKCSDAIQAYRAYYRGEKHKKGLIQYTNREPPSWLHMKFDVKLAKSNVVYSATEHTQGPNEYNWSKQ